MCIPLRDFIEPDFLKRFTICLACPCPWSPGRFREMIIPLVRLRVMPPSCHTHASFCSSDPSSGQDPPVFIAGKANPISQGAVGAIHQCPTGNHLFLDDGGFRYNGGEEGSGHSVPTPGPAVVQTLPLTSPNTEHLKQMRETASSFQTSGSQSDPVAPISSGTPKNRKFRPHLGPVESEAPGRGAPHFELSGCCRWSRSRIAEPSA